MATRRLDREDHVRKHLALMLQNWQEQTGRDMATATADQDRRRPGDPDLAGRLRARLRGQSAVGGRAVQR